MKKKFIQTFVGFIAFILLSLFYPVIRSRFGKRTGEVPHVE